MDLDGDEHSLMVTKSTGNPLIPVTETEVLIDAQPHHTHRITPVAEQTYDDKLWIYLLVGSSNSRKRTVIDEIIRQILSKRTLLVGYHSDDC